MPYAHNGSVDIYYETFGDPGNPALHAGAARQMIAVTVSPSRSEALRGVRVPALVIHGDADKLVDISVGGGLLSASQVPVSRCRRGWVTTTRPPTGTAG
jgi:hypothetical protein